MRRRRSPGQRPQHLTVVGRTAEVLRNLCLEVHNQARSPWDRLGAQVRRLFGVELDAPQYVAARGEIVMTYRERGIRLAGVAENASATPAADRPAASVE